MILEIIVSAPKFPYQIFGIYMAICGPIFLNICYEFPIGFWSKHIFFLKNSLTGNRIFVPQIEPSVDYSSLLHKVNDSANFPLLSRPSSRARTSVMKFFNNKVNRLQYSVLSPLFFFLSQKLRKYR